ncbi:MAG: hypothetical protein ABIQ02_04355 [Saprospiraceae bacterium]
MTKREFFKNELLKMLETKLKKFGFRLNKSLSEFTKNNSSGWQKYQIIFLLTDGGWQVHPAIFIRFNLVEDLFHKISGFEKKYCKGTPTIGISIENYNSNEIPSRFDVTEESQINEISDKLFILFENIALPFYEKYNTLETINQAMNNIPNDVSLTGPIFKGTKSLIVAKLLNDPHYYQLKNRYLEYYRDFSKGFYLPEYTALVKLLDG